MTKYQSIKLEIADGVARLTLARPNHNVFNIEMMNEFNAALEKLMTTTPSNASSSSAKGPAGAPGSRSATTNPIWRTEDDRHIQPDFRADPSLQIPTIAAVHGACLGGGMEVAIACDIVIASDKAVFGQPEIKLGFFPPYAAIRLPELVGPAKAIEVCTTGKLYSADKHCAQWDLSAKLLPCDDFAEAVEKLIKAIKPAAL